MDGRDNEIFGLSDVRRESSRQMTFFLISRGQEPDKDTDKNKKHGRPSSALRKRRETTRGSEKGNTCIKNEIELKCHGGDGCRNGYVPQFQQD